MLIDKGKLLSGNLLRSAILQRAKVHLSVVFYTSALPYYICDTPMYPAPPTCVTTSCTTSSGCFSDFDESSRRKTK